MRNGQTSLLGIFKLLVISVLLAIAVLSIDYTYGLRKAPKSLTHQGRTEHFHIYTDCNEAVVDYYERFFEDFYDYFDKEYVEIGYGRPLKVYLFKDENSYAQYVASINGPRTPYGFYMGLWQNIVVVNVESGLGTATHMLMLHYIRTSFKKRPARWAEDGIAVFFEKFIGHFDESGKLDISFGYFSNWRFPTTKKLVKFFSLNDMVTAEQPDQSNAGALMLFLHKKSLFKEFVKQISAATDDPTSVKTLKKVYGRPLSEIEKDFKDWVNAQPIDENVNLVQYSFVLPDDQWQRWWEKNSSRLYWDETEQIYRIRKR
jgi:hypothetical protein